MQLKEINSKDDIAKTFVVLLQIYDNLSARDYINNILNMMEHGYKMVGVFEDDGACIGVAGTSISHKINFGKTLEIEDFMIHRKKRGIGVGKMLIKWIDWQAMNFDCHNIIGSLKTNRRESQAIFAREKFILDGFHFHKAC